MHFVLLHCFYPCFSCVDAQKLAGGEQPSQAGRSKRTMGEEGYEKSPLVTIVSETAVVGGQLQGTISQSLPLSVFSASTGIALAKRCRPDRARHLWLNSAKRRF